MFVLHTENQGKKPLAAEVGAAYLRAIGEYGSSAVQMHEDVGRVDVETMSVASSIGSTGAESSVLDLEDDMTDEDMWLH